MHYAKKIDPENSACKIFDKKFAENLANLGIFQFFILVGKIKKSIFNFFFYVNFEMAHGMISTRK